MTAFGCCGGVTADKDTEVIVNEPDAAGGEDLRSGSFSDRRERFGAANLKDKYFAEDTLWGSARNFEGVCLFGNKGPIPVDVLHHGKSKHGWFLAALASLAHMHPEYIRTLIEDKGDGVYVVKLYSYAERLWIYFEVWDWVVVDTHGKLAKGQAIGGLGKQLAIWPLLLQMAAGQYIGSFKAMDLGNPAFAFGMLTGCTTSYGLEKNGVGDAYSIYPYKPFTTDKPHDYDYDLISDFMIGDHVSFPESEQFSKIQELLGKKYVMCAFSETKRGWALGAASVLAAGRTASEEDGLQILQLTRSVDDLEVDYEGEDSGMWTMADMREELMYISFVEFTPRT